MRFPFWSSSGDVGRKGTKRVQDCLVQAGSEAPADAASMVTGNFDGK